MGPRDELGKLSMGPLGERAEIGETQNLVRGREARSDSSSFSALAQQHQGPGSYLRFLHLNDPGGRDDDSSVRPEGAGFLDVMQHETGHFIVKLKRETGQ